MSNLHQTYLGVDMYAHDFRDWLPFPCMVPSGVDNNMIYPYQSMGVTNPYYNPTSNFDLNFWTGFYHTYISDPRIWACPSWQHDDTGHIWTDYFSWASSNSGSPSGQYFISYWWLPWNPIVYSMWSSDYGGLAGQYGVTMGEKWTLWGAPQYVDKTAIMSDCAGLEYFWPGGVTTAYSVTQHAAPGIVPIGSSTGPALAGGHALLGDGTVKWVRADSGYWAFDSTTNSFFCVLPQQ